MMRTRWTVGTVSCKPDGQNLVQSAINYAHEMALADAVITLKLRDEMMHEIEGEIASLAKKTPAMQGKDPLTFLPAYIAEAFGEAGWKDTQRFLGISDEQKRGRVGQTLQSLGFAPLYRQCWKCFEWRHRSASRQGSDSKRTFGSARVLPLST